MSQNIELNETDIYNCTYDYSDDTININDFNPKKVKIDKKSYKDILIY